MWSWRVVDKKLHDYQSFGPIISDSQQDDEEEDAENLLHLLMCSLDSSLVRRSAWDAEMLARAHTGDELSHENVREFRASVRTDEDGHGS